MPATRSHVPAPASKPLTGHAASSANATSTASTTRIGGEGIRLGRCAMSCIKRRFRARHSRARSLLVGVRSAVYQPLELTFLDQPGMVAVDKRGRQFAPAFAIADHTVPLVEIPVDFDLIKL